ncbi:MAG: hypothetical protein Q7R64_04055 [bacterium]|nr:hypothetical protein [bacterium]
MKIIITHASSFDYEKEFYEPLKKAVEGTGHELVFPHVWHEQNKSTKEFLKDAGAVIGEVSYPSTGQGIEFGWADTMNIPILFVRKEGAKSSSGLRYLKGEYLDYADLDDLVRKLRSWFTALK